MFGRIFGKVDAYNTMDKNPFSIYDFMGYLFPGIIALFFIQLMWDGNEDSIYNILNIGNFEGITKEINESINIETSIVCIVLSYVIGHIIAYISSVTIEYFANKTFGYPSEYLMSNKEQDWFDLLSRYFLDMKKEDVLVNGIMKSLKSKLLSGRFWWRLIISTILSPLSFMTFTFSHLSGINNFIIRPLDDYLKNSIQEKSFKMANRLGINYPSNGIDCDYHRVIMHYVYYNLPVCQNKTDNYISLYGFLRSICFILNGMFLFITIKIIPTLDFNASFDEKKVWTWSILFVLSYISFLAFVKFYRRFTLENYMIMLTERKVEVEVDN